MPSKLAGLLPNDIWGRQVSIGCWQRHEICRVLSDSAVSAVANASKLGDVEHIVPPPIRDLIPKGKPRKEFLQKLKQLCKAKVSQMNSSSHLLAIAMGLKGKRPFVVGNSNADYLIHCIRHNLNELNFFSFPSVVAAAARSNDEKFFLRLAKAIKERRVKRCNPEKAYTESIEAFLCGFWFHDHDHLPDLCLFTDHALAKLCEITFGSSLSEKRRISELRLRLGLAQCSDKVVVDALLVQGRLKFVFQIIEVSRTPSRRITGG